jgi:uncharacterized protein
MHPSVYNVQVPLKSGDVFLMNTLTDAQMVVSTDVVALMDRVADVDLDGDVPVDDRAALALLSEHGFVVPGRQADLERLEVQFREFHEDTSQLRVTVLTTLQCNFACEYCYQGDRGQAIAPGDRMTAETAEQVAAWIGRQLDVVKPQRLVLTFFGGEPLLNLPALYLLAHRCRALVDARGITQAVNLITNGLLLTPDIVDRLLPFGLSGVKVTLDGDRETHDRARPLRGGQGTFDRIIENIGRVTDKIPIAIGGNFDVGSLDRFPALLDLLRAQPFAARISDVGFKPVIRPKPPADVQPVAAADESGLRGCSGGGSLCDSCHLGDDPMAFLRAETLRRGLPARDGLRMGPCELYRRHSHTIGPDGSLFACAGFTGTEALHVGHVAHGPVTALWRPSSPSDAVAPWRQCGNCAFVPVCGGGCAVAARAELGDMLAPSCHKRSFESALVALAESTAGGA